tara:strand:+ start:598 stop:1299 length:702 start_codon:yes stop_codon:yes gene_type:complete
MTNNEMLTLLGTRLEDPSGDLFTNTTKLLLLNVAQDKVIQLLNSNALIDLHHFRSNVANENDSVLNEKFIDITSSVFTGANTPFGGVYGIQAIKRTNSSVYYHKISFEQYTDWSNGSVSISFQSPVYWFRGNRVYISDNDALDVYYIKKPTAIVADDNSSSLNSIYHDAILEFAEAECWRTVNQQDRQADAQNRAIAMITSHNESSVVMDYVSGMVPYNTSGDLVIQERVVGG